LSIVVPLLRKSTEKVESGGEMGGGGKDA